MSIIQFLAQEQEQQTGMIWDYVSPSRLNLWLKCPLAFRKKYIDGEPTSPSPALFVGKVVHSVLAHVYRHRIAGHLCEIEELPMHVADAWKMSMELEPCFFCDDAEEEKARYQVLDLTTAYLETVPVQEERPVAIEKRYEVPLVTPQGEDLGIPLVGIVDLIIENEHGHIIVDFKTSATSSICEMQHELQLTAYSYLFRSIMDEHELHSEIRQLIKTKVPKVQCSRFPRRSKEHISRFFDLVREYLDALDKGVYNYRPGWTCSMCDHYGTCC
jgi:putative RecB family exonuclease